MNKIGRNDPCPCGSGKKYKTCCGAQASAAPPPAEKMRMAWQCFQLGARPEAEQLAQSVLETQPRDADALYLRGVICLESGDFRRAIEWLEKAVAAAPARPELHLGLGSALAGAARQEEALRSLRQAVQIDPQFAAAHNRLGALLQELGQLEEAVASFQRAAACAPGFAPALCNLGTVYKQLGKDAQAIAAFEEAIKADPTFIGALANLAIVLRGAGQLEKAMPLYQRVLALNPLHAQTHIALGNLCKEQQRYDEALHHFEQALRGEPGNIDARFQIDSIKHAKLDRAPLEYVRNLFDSFAEDFDRKLVDVLGYAAPRMLMQAIEKAAGGKNDWRVLDLGCGTGLMGVEIKPHTSRLAGVDASPRMLAMADARGIYDELIESDLLRHMQDLPADGFDLICAADVFIYVGDLAPVFAEAARILPAGGLFAFSLEANLTDDQVFRLHEGSRYAHAKSGIEALSAEAGFEIAHFADCSLRQEAHTPVPGYLLVLRKRLADALDSNQARLPSRTLG